MSKNEFKRILPIFGYVGGKSRLATEIANLIPPHDLYCEVFAGSCAVLFAKYGRQNLKELRNKYNVLGNFQKQAVFTKEYHEVINDLNSNYL